MTTEPPHAERAGSTHQMAKPVGGAPRRAGSSAAARLVSPFIAVVPWFLTMTGLTVASRWHITIVRTMESSWAVVIGGTALLILAALIWAALTAWSSVGTFVAGACTLLLGLLLSSPEVYIPASRKLFDGSVPGWQAMALTLSPPTFLLIGSLLLAASLGAAGARRRGR